MVTKMLQKRADKARRKQEQRLAALEERVRAQVHPCLLMTASHAGPGLRGHGPGARKMLLALPFAHRMCPDSP